MRKIIVHKLFMPQLNREKIIRVCLPIDYDENLDKQYSVIYMHDGQNLFEPNMSFGGTYWQVSKTLDKQIALNKSNDFIVVGMDCNNEHYKRFDKYSPWLNDENLRKAMNLTQRVGGEGDKYADFVVDTVKKFVDCNYRTKPDRNNTHLCGSSMGGFITLYIGLKYNNIFRGLGIFSPAIFFAEKECINFIINKQTLLNQKYFIFVGTNESVNDIYLDFPRLFIESALIIRDGLINKEIDDKNIEFILSDGEIHNERSWSKYFGKFLEFIS